MASRSKARSKRSEPSTDPRDQRTAFLPCTVSLRDLGELQPSYGNHDGTPEQLLHLRVRGVELEPWLRGAVWMPLAVLAQVIFGHLPSIATIPYAFEVQGLAEALGVETD